MEHIPSRPVYRTAVLLALAAVTLTVGACGSPAPGRPGGPPAAGTGAASPDAAGPVSTQLVIFSRCVRSHGVPNFPDPQPGASNAKFPTAQQLRVSSSQLSAAETTCQHLLPIGVDDQFPASEVPILLHGMLPFARCMRSDGVPNFPDPSVDSQGRPLFMLSAHGISRSYSHSNQFDAVMGKCQHLLPRQLGGIPFG